MARTICLSNWNLQFFQVNGKHPRALLCSKHYDKVVQTRHWGLVSSIAIALLPLGHEKKSWSQLSEGQLALTQG